MMQSWTERLEKRLAHGAYKHGPDVFARSSGWLAAQLVAEAADVGGWSVVLRARALQYPEGPERDAVLHATVELARASLRLHWGVSTLRRWLPASALERLPTPATLPALPWITRAPDLDDEVFPQHAPGDGASWGDTVLARLRRGYATYGDQSFHRPGAELCLELGDELCGLAGWAWVLRNNVEVSLVRLAPLEVVDRQLRGLARSAGRTYHLAAAAQVVCVGLDALPPGAPSRLDQGAAEWLAFVAQTTRRHYTTAPGTV